jgi:hypothetical protein
MDSVRRTLRLFVPLVWVVSACLPAYVAFRSGWLAVGLDVTGQTQTGLGSPGGIERWVAFALFYLIWMAITGVVFVWSNDRLGVRWRPSDRAPHLPEKRRRRVVAGLRFLDGQEEARSSSRKRPAGGPR